jgi:hypothetical protein
MKLTRYRCIAAKNLTTKGSRFQMEGTRGLVTRTFWGYQQTVAIIAINNNIAKMLKIWTSLHKMNEMHQNVIVFFDQNQWQEWIMNEISKVRCKWYGILWKWAFKRHLKNCHQKCCAVYVRFTWWRWDTVLRLSFVCMVGRRVFSLDPFSDVHCRIFSLDFVCKSRHVSRFKRKKGIVWIWLRTILFSRNPEWSIGTCEVEN